MKSSHKYSRKNNKSDQKKVNESIIVVALRAELPFIDKGLFVNDILMHNLDLNLNV